MSSEPPGGSRTTGEHDGSSGYYSVLRGKRVLVAAEALRTESGHWYEYVKSVVELNRFAGAETVVASHADADPAICRELNAYPIFPSSSWYYIHPQAWRQYIDVALHNFRVYLVMSRFLNQQGPFDILFAPTVVIFQLIGWRLLMMTHGRNGIKQIILLFMTSIASYNDASPTPVFKKSAVIYKLILRSFLPLLKCGRARFATDSTKLAMEYRILC